MSRVFAFGAALLLMLSLPTAAFAVNVSSNDGSGTQSVKKWYQCSGAYIVGTLKSTAGRPVYYSGKMVYDGEIDEYHGRYTTNTSSKTTVTKNGQLGGTGTSCTNRPDGAALRVCRDRKNMPDPCGSYTKKIRSPWD